MPFGIIDCTPKDGRLLPGSEFLIDDKRSTNGIDGEEAGRLKCVTHKVIAPFFHSALTMNVLGKCQLLKASGNGDDPRAPAQ